MVPTVTCPNCQAETLVKLPSSPMEEVTINCESCGESSTFVAMEVPMSIIHKLGQFSIEKGMEHQNHTIGGMMARQHFITSHGCDWPIATFRTTVEYGDELLEAAKGYAEESGSETNWPQVIQSLIQYATQVDSIRDMQMATCQAIATLKLVEVPESCYQDFCENEGEESGK